MDLSYNLKNLNSSTRIIQNATTQIVTGEGGKIFPLGSGIFAEINDRFFLISAGHLISLNDYNKLMVPLPGKKEALYIDTLGNLLTTGKRGDEECPFDYALIEITKDELVNELLECYTPIKDDYVLFNHVPQYNDSWYLVFGYSSNKGSVDYKTLREFNAAPTRTITYPHPDQEDFIKSGYYPEHHIILKYQKKIWIHGQRIILPKTKGLSGCGVYFLPDLYNEDPDSSAYLVGILTEVDIKRQYMCAVNLPTIFTGQL
ncbi:hypothetical protein [Membranihabitans maritimus]|uniref:hypothetical protein n=1 Tax=Membranihabitans maritimus TaxID=2904244 RepID=UPI001F38CD6E|nr:hypothetical protein [Membranihabitans maritimus]